MVHLSYIVTGTGRSGTVSLANLLTDLGIPCSHERFFNGGDLEEVLRLLNTTDGENSYCSRHCGLPEQTDQVVAESSYMAAPYLDESCFADATIIHAVRNPWKVILSFLNHLQFFRGEPEHEHERFIYSMLPQLHEIDNAVDRAAYYYIHWNRMIEELARKQRAKLHGGFLGICQRTIHKLSRYRRRSCYIFHRIEDDSTTLLRNLGASRECVRRCRKKTNMNAFKEWPKELGAYAPIRWVRIEQINASKYAGELRMLAKRYGYQVPSSEQPRTKAESGESGTKREYEVRFAEVPRLLEAGYRGYNLVRWRDVCYALPQGEDIDLQVASVDLLRDLEENCRIVVARCLSELKAMLDKLNNGRAGGGSRRPPILIESGYRCYNLVLWGTEYYALHQQSLCDLALETAAANVLQEALAQGTLLAAPTLHEAKEKVDQVICQHPELEQGQPFGSRMKVKEDGIGVLCKADEPAHRI